MHQSHGSRRSAARLVGMTVVGVLYAATLVWAADISAVDESTPSAEGSGPVAAAVAAAGQVDTSMREARAVTSEAPLATLGVAAALLLAGGSWYAVHAVRQRHPIARRARLVVRHITTLI